MCHCGTMIADGSKRIFKLMKAGTMKFGILFNALLFLGGRWLLASATLVSLEISGPEAVDELTETGYTCIAHYSDSSAVDVTALADWSIVGSANTGVWNADLWDAKSESEAHDIPMLYVWGTQTCSYCDALDSYIARPAFQQWMQERQLIMASVKAAGSAATPEKDFAKYGQNGTLYDYPFVAVYRHSKSAQPWNFTARYSGGGEETQFIAEIESYLGDYVSSPGNSAKIGAGGQLTAFAVSEDTAITINAFFGGINQQKPVLIRDVPAPVLLDGESFETGFGRWTHAVGNDFNWTRRTGTTPSGSTGPSGAADGSYYIFTEATGNNPAKTAAIERVFDCSTATEPVLTFAYHMYGSAMGSLSVDIYDGIWHNAVWSRTGQQHGGVAAVWSQAEVDLSLYAGVIIIRIRGVTGTGFTSDMAVDTIRLLESGVAVPQSFSDWLDAESVPLGQRGESDTPAGDDIANLLKYACGLSALQAASTADLLDIVAGAAPDVFTVRYYKSKSAVGVILQPIWASALNGVWQSSGIATELVDEDHFRQEWNASIPLDQAGFLRLRATPVE